MPKDISNAKFLAAPIHPNNAATSGSRKVGGFTVVLSNITVSSGSRFSLPRFKRKTLLVRPSALSARHEQTTSLRKISMKRQQIAIASCLEIVLFTWIALPREWEMPHMWG
jgi:hypothetical protein